MVSSHKIKFNYVRKKIYENFDSNKILLLLGPKTSQLIRNVIQDIDKMKACCSKKLRRNNEIRNFDPESKTDLLFICQKNNCSIFCVASHNKKRPHNLIFGRIYNVHLLEMIELGVNFFISGSHLSKKVEYQMLYKPYIAFVGIAFDLKPDCQVIRSLFLDIFRGYNTISININAIKSVVFIISHRNMIYLRRYRTIIKKSGNFLLNLELEEYGSSINFAVRHNQLTSEKQEWETENKFLKRDQPKFSNLSSK